MEIKLFLIVIIFSLQGCQLQNGEGFSIDRICACYRSLNLPDSGDKLNSCLEKFNHWVNQQSHIPEEREKLGKERLIEVMLDLVKTCNSFQFDLNNDILSRYRERELSYQPADRDSIIQLIEAGVNSTVNKTLLAEYEILEGNLESALDLVNESLKENPKIEYAYIIRGFLRHKQGEYKEAKEDLGFLKGMTEDENLISLLRLWMANLDVESSK